MNYEMEKCKIGSENADNRKKMENEKINISVTMEKNNYPEKLRHIYKPPRRLYVKGELPDNNKISIAVIGARDCSVYGKEVALFFSRELAKAGIQIISGLARGIDAAAHQGCLEGEGKTFAVLGSGIDLCYPKQNQWLYNRIKEKGGIISEYPDTTPPIAGHFPVRNRIISGLADGILVVEAREKSGSLITVDYGLEQGKDIFIVPGRINDSLSKGCLNLWKMGAIPVTSPADIMEYYGEKISAFKPVAQTIVDVSKEKMTDSEQKIYETLDLYPKHFNAIVCETKLQTVQVMQHLLSLKSQGKIGEPVKGYFIKKLS